MKTKDIRQMLCASLARAEKGELKPDDAKTIIGLANQISQSLSVECKVIAMKLRLGAQVDAIGGLNVAE